MIAFISLVKNNMKLHQIPRGSKIKTDEGIVTFHRTDWMYSYCTVDWEPKWENVAHLHVLQELKKEWEFYILSE